MICRACQKEMADTPFCPLCGASQTPKTQAKRTRANGEGSVYKLPSGKWKAVLTLDYVRDENGKRKSRRVKTRSGFSKKKDALAALTEMKSKPIEVAPNITFAEMYARWSKEHFASGVTKDTIDNYRAAYKYFASIYHLIFSQLKTQDYQAAVDACPHGRRTKQNMKAVLTSMYKFAMQNDYVTKDYAQYVKLPKKEKSKKDGFTKEERERLWKDYNAGNEHTGYVLIMCYTGMRYGEIATIYTANINLEKHYMIGGIKTEAGTDRIIPIADIIYPIVQKFTGRGGQKLLDMPEKQFYTLFYESLRRAGVRKLSPHACRHTAATALAEAGVQPAIIQAILGHEDYATTMQYTHIPIAELLAGVNAIDKDA
jgi:integrase